MITVYVSQSGFAIINNQPVKRQGDIGIRQEYDAFIS